VRVPSRLEPLHAPLPLAGRLMGVFSPIVQIAVLAMVHTGEELALGGTVALELVRDDHPGSILAALEQLAEEFLCRGLVPPALDQDIKDMAVLIHGPPEIVAGAPDRQKDLIQVPLIPKLEPSVAQLIGIHLAKLPAPFPDRFISDDDATGEEELFDVTVAETKAEIEPDAMADDLGREAVVLVTVR
jgi:hypothetical protein